MRVTPGLLVLSFLGWMIYVLIQITDVDLKIPQVVKQMFRFGHPGIISIKGK